MNFGVVQNKSRSLAFHAPNALSVSRIYCLIFTRCITSQPQLLGLERVEKSLNFDSMPTEAIGYELNSPPDF